MVIYEIAAIVQDELIERYEKYMLGQHIPDLLATGHFSGAFFTRSTTAGNHYRVQYHARDQDSLDEYLKTDAERLRADFLRHFPEGVEVSREIWEIVESFATMISRRKG